MGLNLKKVISASTVGAVSVLEIMNLQPAQAVPTTFTGSSVTYPLGGTVQVVITVDGASGTYKITNVATPVQPTTGPNASFAAFAIPKLTSEALAVQSATINGVSGASQISTAWISSLSSAIAAAAAAGQQIGKPVSATTPTPTPTPTITSTPTPAPTVTPIPNPSRTGKGRRFSREHEDDRSSRKSTRIKSEHVSSHEGNSLEHD